MEIKKMDGASCHWIFTCTFSFFMEKIIVTTCCRDGLNFITLLFVVACV